MNSVNEVPRYTITLATKPGMVAWWVDKKRQAGHPFVIVRGHSARGIVIAYTALANSGTVLVYDPSGASRKYHPTVGLTDKGDATRSEHLTFELHVLLGPAEPLGPAVGVQEMGEGRLFLYGLPLPTDEDTQYSTAVHSGARLVSVGPLHFHTSVGSQG